MPGWIGSPAQTAAAKQACTADLTPPTDADVALYKGDYATAEELYRQRLATSPEDEEVRGQLVRTLLQRVKLADAEALANRFLKDKPDSSAAETAMGRVAYRQGDMPGAYRHLSRAVALDACNGRAHSMPGRVHALTMMDAAAIKQIVTAHALKPTDDEIHVQWMYWLPVPERIEPLTAYIAHSPSYDKRDENTPAMLEGAKPAVAHAGPSCRLVSRVSEATLALQPIYALPAIGAERARAESPRKWADGPNRPPLSFSGMRKRSSGVAVGVGLALGTVCLPWLCGAQAAGPAASYYVAPSGSDANPGSQARPFATLDAARDAVRRLKRQGLPAGGVTVWIGGGLYTLDHGFALEAVDSGEPGRPVVYRGLEGQPPRIFGGVRLDPHAFVPVTDPGVLARLSPEAKGHVVQLQLGGKTGLPGQFPAIFKGNGGLPRLFRNGAAMPLSRWPNAGYTTMETVLDSGIAPPRGGTFRYREEVASHAERWAAEARAGNLWLTGFWRVPFETESVQVRELNPTARTITLAAPVPNGIGSKYVNMVNGTRPGDGKEHYFAFNLLSEIDTPGEWSYDFNTHTIYFWPPAPLDAAKDELLFASLASPVVSLQAAHHVTLRGVQIEGGVNEGISLRDASDDLVAGDVVRNTGGGGVDIEGGARDVVQSNDLVHIGTFGIRMVAGDRKTLTPANDVAENNHIWHFGEQERITEAIYLGGVGNRASHNLIHDGPKDGIVYQGNDLEMTFNELHHIGLDAGDLGAFYTNGDWAGQGNVIAGNFVHHAPTANGTYFDDGASGHTARGNIFYKLSVGLFISGGHDNTGVNNLIGECKTGIHVDDRGVARHYDATAHHLTATLKTIDPNRPPWSTHYPNFLADILADPTHPTGNVFDDNALVNDGTAYQLASPGLVDPAKNPAIAGDPGFVDEKELNLNLAPGSPILKALPGFKPIPLDQIGLRVDEYRHRLPTAEETGRYTDARPTINFDSNTDMKASDRLAKPQ